MREEPRVRPRPGDFPDPEASNTVRYNPSFEALRSLSAALETTTEFGSAAYVSEYRSRSADRTKNTVDHAFTAEDDAAIETALSAVRTEEMVCVDRRVGRHPDAAFTCRLFVPPQYARIALAWAKLLEPADGEEPDFVTVQLPDRDPTRIRVLPEAGVTAVLGSDYTGEAKKSFLRLFMHRAKQQGGLGLHAGSKRVCLSAGDAGEDAPGRPLEDAPDRSGGSTSGERAGGEDLREVGQVFLGLSGTGKSTLTSHGLWLDPPERAEMLQDDVCALLPDGTVAGSEGNGLYIKTIGLTESEQPELYRAATDERAVLENVALDDDGTVDLGDDAHTANCRAVILRECLDSAAEDIDLGRVDQLFFITRNPLVPPIARLTPAQAAAAFMLGESIETSAGDPSKAGESIRVVGTNPFIVGSEGAEGNRFRELIADLDVEPYLINTGEVGTDDPRDVAVEDTVSLLTAVARGRIEWRHDDDLGLDVPASVPGLDVTAFSVADRVDEFESAIEALRDERRAYLSRFDDLDPAIKDAVY